MMGIEPVTRKEMFMAAAAGESVVAPTPVTREEYFLSKIAGSGGGGGGGVQPDWNQNDDTQPDYVKNRPFYSEAVNVTVEAVTSVELERFPVFAVGDTVTVNVDGVEHSLVAYDDDGYIVIGDTYSSINNGEGQLGWQISVNSEGQVQFDSKEAHTVSYLYTVYHPIDQKFLKAQYTEYKITEQFDIHGNSTYSCELSFNEAYSMGEEKLLKSIKYSETFPTVVNITKTRNLGKVIVLKFDTYAPNYDATVSVKETLFIWTSSALSAATRDLYGKISGTEILLKSYTPGSHKKFKITVDDSGTLTATEVT